MLEALTGTGLAASAGLNAYIPLVTMGPLARYTDTVELPGSWQWLSNGWVLALLTLLLAIEVVADKVPVVDHVNDVVQTVVRPTAGGLAFGAGSSSETVTVADPGAFFSSHQWVPIAAGVIIALCVHGVKATSRPVVNASTGGLGAPVGMYLAAAGVGRIGIVDFDVVEESNLQRQIIHGTKDLGRRKIESARDRLRDINPHIEIETHETRLTSQNAMRLFRNYDIIVDGTDNFPTRYLVNDACVLSGKPNVYGSIFRFEGQASVFWAEKGVCYRCLYPEPPPPGLVPSCAEGGVLGVLPGIVGAIQANETIKIILGAEDLMINRLLLFDAWTMKFREFKLRKDPKCPVCGENPTVKKLIDYEEFCGMAAHQAPAPETRLEEISATELNARRLRGDAMQIIDVREPHEFEIAKIPGTKLIPLGHVVGRMNEINPEVETIVHCKGGVRSAKAIAALKRAGFQGRLVNLKGGITAWSEDVDPRVPKY